jgi:hypothetical protein
MATSNLTSYITEVQRLLHDANSNFYSTTELTDYINAARERVVRDTGCLRTLQVTTTPSAPIGYSGNVAAWTANTAVTIGQLLFNNIFTYTVTQAGTTGSTSPIYPTGTAPYPPSTPFVDGTAKLQYAGPVEIIPMASLPQGINTIDVLNVSIFWGNSRYPLSYLPWTQFNAQLRYWQNYTGRPVAFSKFGQNQIYLGPVPDQIYTVEIDTVILPTPLVSSADTDPINDPYTTPVAYYAAYKAKFKEQSYGEAEIFKQQYKEQLLACLNSTFTRRIPDVYSSPY